MLILGLDVSTNVGWALYDTKSPMSSILTGAFYVGGGSLSPFQKCSKMRAEMVRVIKELEAKGMKPEFSVIEAPLARVMQYKKVGSDLGGDTAETSMNPGAVMILNRLAGVVQTVIEGFRIPCTEVAPRSWQAAILKPFKGDTKQKSKSLCDQLRVQAKNEHARDAVGIAIWAAGHCQEMKLLERARSQ